MATDGLVLGGEQQSGIRDKGGSRLGRRGRLVCAGGVEEALELALLLREDGSPQVQRAAEQQRVRRLRALCLLTEGR